MSVLLGSSEARNESYRRYGDVSTGIANDTERHKLPAQPAVLPGREAVQVS